MQDTSKGKVEVRTVVQSSTANPFSMDFRSFADQHDAVVHVGHLWRDGMAFEVSWGIWQDDEQLDSGFSDRDEAVEVARKLNDGEEDI